MCLTLCLGFGSEKGPVYLVGMLRETRGVVVYGGVVLVRRVVVNGGGGLENAALRGVPKARIKLKWSLTHALLGVHMLTK